MKTKTHFYVFLRYYAAVNKQHGVYRCRKVTINSIFACSVLFTALYISLSLHSGLVYVIAFNLIYNYIAGRITSPPVAQLVKLILQFMKKKHSINMNGDALCMCVQCACIKNNHILPCDSLERHSAPMKCA